jgi:hypothetical protein
LVIVLIQQNVLRLQVGVNQIQVVQEGDACEELACEVPYLTVGEGDEAVAFQEVEDALTQEIHNDADVAAIVETVIEVYAPVTVLLVVGFERGKHPQLDSASIAVFLN